MTRCVTLGVAAMVAAAGAAQAGTIYVNSTLATGSNNGSSWDNAFRGPGGLAAAITASIPGDQIWVAQGRYIPSTTGVRTASFGVKPGVEIYGGFAGTESQLSQRDYVTRLTILSGDLSGDDAAWPSTTGWSENSQHVVSGLGAGTGGVLDGFTVTGGNSNGSSTGDLDRGGGMIFLNSANPTVRNCRIIHNRVVFGGGGMYLRTASPTFVNVTFEANFGASFGGAIDMFSGCGPVFRSCSFIGNSAARAGGVEVFGSCTPTLVNCLFRGNSSTGSGGGGGMYVASNSSPTLRNCTLAANTAVVNGGGILFSASGGSLGNCIVWGNTGPGGSTAGQQLTGVTTTTVQYSLVQGGVAGTGNISGDPLFVSPAGGDFRLGAGSPAIDAASNPLVTAGTTLDLAGAPRFVDDPATPDTGVGPGPVVDIGAYEFQPAACYANCDGSTTAPVLNVLDFVCFQAQYAQGSSTANCDGSTTPPVLNVLDFICFQGRYAQGCP